MESLASAAGGTNRIKRQTSIARGQGLSAVVPEPIDHLQQGTLSSPCFQELLDTWGTSVQEKKRKVQDNAEFIDRYRFALLLYTDAKIRWGD
ncbi:hypothetical protein BaRGS_00009383 [Batillaria attramentaria]|uniref:Uncharacterized protein n=1 Tax=Batillaria attramentaria TaxID=370345 RepID=A0ABD0LJR0_9CAEN